jgi:hypothetical protein
MIPFGYGFERMLAMGMRPPSLEFTRLVLVLVAFLALPLAAILAKSLQNADGAFVGLANFAAYVKTPALLQSFFNSVWVSALVTVLTVPLAFGFAYAMTRSCIPGKGVFRTIALIPLLAPSLLSALSLIYSSDGNMLAAVGGSPARFGEAQFWDAKTNKMTTQQMTHPINSPRKAIIHRPPMSAGVKYPPHGEGPIAPVAGAARIGHARSGMRKSRHIFKGKAERSWPSWFGPWSSDFPSFDRSSRSGLN